MLQRYAVACLATAVMLAGCSSSSPTGGHPQGPEGRLYVLNQGANTFYVFDTKTSLRIDSVSSQVNRPHYVEFSPDGQYFYITTLEPSGHIAKFRASDNGFVDSASVVLSVQPSAIAITLDGQYGYVCNFSPAFSSTRIHKYDLSTLTVVDSVQAGATTHDVKITSDGKIVIATNRNTDDLTMVYTDLDTVTFVNIDPNQAYPPGTAAYGPMGVIIDHKDSLAFVACRDGHQVRWLDIAKREIVDSIDIPIDSTAPGYGPTLLAISPDDDVVYVTTGANNTVAVFRVSTKTVLASIPMGTPNPFGITISDDGSRVYAACIGPLGGADGRVYVIDGGTHAVVDSLDVGAETYGLTWHSL